MPETIAIAGDGQMALVMSAIAAESGHAVRLWSPFPEAAKELEKTRESPRLHGFRLPESVRVGASIAEAFAGATLAISAIPTQFARAVWQRIAPTLPAVGIVTVTKGVEVTSLCPPLEVLRAATGRRPLAVLSGPTIAGELARQLPATLLCASDDPAFAQKVQGIFARPWLRIYTSPDPIGVEIAGAAKNVVALAAGMLDGLGMGYNAKSALLARGLSEISRLGLAMGAKQETFFGIAGVGDLATTCFCPEGRNRSLGEKIGRGVSLADALAATDSVVEGVETCKSLRALAQKHAVELPIAAAVHQVLFEHLPPAQAVRDLMSRSSKAERIG
ncbi:MAG: NAD(P)-dependent glycerol-3-phosphate dehydrogenase [Planctomycetes bacterium]|nr:NAD(P)-dependent glycerol-3-phosphate dehydrogenase [Planctomycetota bacterium]